MATTCKLIAKTTLGSAASSIEFTSIPGTYTDLLCVASARSSFTSASVHFRVVDIRPNGATTNLSSRQLYGAGSTAGSESFASNIYAYITNNSGTTSTFGAIEIYIPNYAGSTNKSISVTSLAESNDASKNIMSALAGLWSSTTAISSLELNAATAAGVQFMSGSSFYLYGITKA